MLNQVEYYRSPDVRERIREYCGTTDENGKTRLTAEYVVGYGEALLWDGREEAFLSIPKDDMDYLFEKGLDVFRSNWDRIATLGVMDVEYFNIDYPGEIYLNPQRCFEQIEPTRQAVRAIFRKYGIPFIEIMTGQGYHFSTRVLRDTAADAELIEIGQVNDSVRGKYAHPNPNSRRHRYVSLQHGRSFDGMGRVMEYVTHLAMRAARGQSNVPIVTTDVAVGHGRHGREAISMDLSMYGDPIYMRDIRCPFSTHQKHKVMRYKVGEQIARDIPVQTCFPTGNDTVQIPLSERLRMRRHFRWTSEWAKSCGNLSIPVANDGFLALIAEYKRSRLAEFHRHFDSAEHDHWTKWPQTYDRFNLSHIPPCVAHCLQEPNPHLLKPTNLQTLTRTLMFLGWHPRHIAGLVRSKFERNYNWEGGWAKYDAAMRADFYVRLFAGQIWTGLDQHVDQNCVSHAQKGYCLRPWCGYSLGDYR